MIKYISTNQRSDQMHIHQSELSVTWMSSLSPRSSMMMLLFYHLTNIIIMMSSYFYDLQQTQTTSKEIKIWLLSALQKKNVSLSWSSLHWVFIRKPPKQVWDSNVASSPKVLVKLVKKCPKLVFSVVSNTIWKWILAWQYVLSSAFLISVVWSLCLERTVQRWSLNTIK